MKTARYMVTSRALRRAFVFALALGIAWVALVQFVVPSFWFVIAGPVAIMGAYVLYYEQGYGSDTVREQFADSLYYLGFLMTIVSLIASLAPHAGDVSGVSAEEVLSRFGIALVTTLLGLGGRVYYSHFTTTVEEVSAEAQASLSDRTYEFISDLALCSESMRNVVRDIQAELDTACCIQDCFTSDFPVYSER